MQHSLYSFFHPKCIAVVGASDRYGSTGRSVFSLLLATLDKVDLLPINHNHKTVAGHKAFDSLAEAAKDFVIDTVIVILSADKLSSILREASKLGIRQVVMINELDPTPANVSNKLAKAGDLARKLHIHLLAVPVHGLRGLFYPAPSELATLSYIGQSAGIADCMESYARERKIRFNRFLTLTPLNYPVSTGQLIDFVAAESSSSALLVHISYIDHAQELLSALTAAARVKPVVVLTTLSDERQERLFMQALARNHILTVDTLADFLSAAKLIHTGLFSRGKRIGIISNTPQITALSVKTMPQLGLELAQTSLTTVRSINRLLTHKNASDNPIYLPSNAAPHIFQAVAEALLQDENTDAVFLIYAGSNHADNVHVAKMVSSLQSRFRKPLLLIWLGSADNPEIRQLFNQRKNLHFRQPEHALHALVQLNHYRNHQQKRYHTSAYFDYSRAAAAAESLRPHIQAWLPMAVLPTSKSTHIHFLNAINAYNLTSSRKKVPADLLIEWKSLEPFGQVFVLKTELNTVELLPPVLPAGLLAALKTLNLDEEIWLNWLLETAELLSLTPTIHDLALKMTHDEKQGLACTDIKLNIYDPETHSFIPNIIAPFPLIHENITLPNGVLATIRPLRPEDAELIQTLISNQSEHSRYMRFMSKFKTLPPSLLSRLSSIDYQRECALIMLDDHGRPLAMASYTADANLCACEFGISIDDQYQGLGLGRILMQHLIRFARKQGFQIMRAEILTDNRPMQKLALKLDFVLSRHPSDHNVINAVLEL